MSREGRSSLIPGTRPTAHDHPAPDTDTADTSLLTLGGRSRWDCSLLLCKGSKTSHLLQGAAGPLSAVSVSVSLSVSLPLSLSLCLSFSLPLCPSLSLSLRLSRSLSSSLVLYLPLSLPVSVSLSPTPLSLSPQLCSLLPPGTVAEGGGQAD